jgi:hypothetical protein
MKQIKRLFIGSFLILTWSSLYHLLAHMETYENIITQKSRL